MTFSRDFQASDLKASLVTHIQKKFLYLLKKAQHSFPKRGGWGGQRPFRVFPKTHPNLFIQSSLRPTFGLVFVDFLFSGFVFTYFLWSTLTQTSLPRFLGSKKHPIVQYHCLLHQHLPTYYATSSHQYPKQNVYVCFLYVFYVFFVFYVFYGMMEP